MNDNSFSVQNYASSGGNFNRTGPVKIPLKQRINQINDDFNDILSNDGTQEGDSLEAEKLREKKQKASAIISLTKNSQANVQALVGYQNT